MEEQLQQQQFEYHFPPIPPPQEQQQENFFSSQQLLNLQQTQLNPLPRSEIQQQTIKKRALNGQGSGRKAPGRVAAAGVGEIVEVEGGHIIRSTGRKDRHSKVCTAKGPRDRRVRLSAHTAIQFYDVQDRLGYDRPSKAVDWLINKAKSAIDELDELPPWKPVATANDSKNPADGAGDGVYGRNNDKCSSLLPPSMDSNSIAAAAAAPAVEFQSYPGFDLQSRRDSSRSQDLKLSLQSFQDPMIIQSNRSQEEEEEERQSPFGFDNPPAVTSWDVPQPPDLSRFQRLIGWNFGSAGNSAGGGSGGGGYMFVPPPQQQPPPLLFGHGVGQAATHFFTQRGTLQSNNTPLVRACTNGESSVINQDHHHHHQGVSVQPVSFSGIGFASSNGGFSSFHIPARIQGDHEEEEQDGNKPSSVASTSRH